MHAVVQKGQDGGFAVTLFQDQIDPKTNQQKVNLFIAPKIGKVNKIIKEFFMVEEEQIEENVEQQVSN